MIAIQALNLHEQGANIQIYEDPNECPHCHRSITAQRKLAYITIDGEVEIIYRCPHLKCGKIFIGYYQNESNKDTNFIYNRTSIGTIQLAKFSQNIKELSPTFVTIFNQAEKAEEMGLDQICGVGYRKAIEFLIKDYLIELFAEKEDEIKKKLLGGCIKDLVTNDNVKQMAKRATWLGNDQTHYVRKWIEKDLNDLKTLIKVTIHWIEMDKLTESFKTDMEESPPKSDMEESPPKSDMEKSPPKQ